jgi:hypothetical protein
VASQTDIAKHPKISTQERNSSKVLASTAIMIRPAVQRLLSGST